MRKHISRTTVLKLLLTLVVAIPLFVACNKDVSETPATPSNVDECVSVTVEPGHELIGVSLDGIEPRIKAVIERTDYSIDRDGMSDADLHELAITIATAAGGDEADVEQAMLQFFSLNTPEVKVFLAYLRDECNVVYQQQGIADEEYATYEQAYDEITNEVADYAQSTFGQPFHVSLFNGIGYEEIQAHAYAVIEGYDIPAFKDLCPNTEATGCLPMMTTAKPCNNLVGRKAIYCRNSEGRCWHALSNTNVSSIKGFRPFTPNAWLYYGTVAQPNCSGCARRLPCSASRLILEPFWCQVYGMQPFVPLVGSWQVTKS